MIFNDEYFMRLALKEAEKAAKTGEIPVGAVLVSNGTIIAKTHNQTELLGDVTAHAEIIAISSGAANLGGKYLNDCTLYVTLEPCVMCAGAITWAQLGTLVYGASDQKRGYTSQNVKLHPKTKVSSGVLAEESETLLNAFFKTLRK